jgi:hypothetical protein
MKGCNSIEEYNDAFRKQFKDNWEAEVRHCQNWLAGERSYFKVGWLENCKDEKYVKDKLAYSQKMLDNIDYYVQSHSYSYKKSKVQKDNDMSFVGNGTSWACCSTIRVPKLKRKTAWKRFYKMFPDLKGMKVISGKSSCYGKDIDGKYYQTIQNASTIKLKKLKKKRN